MLNQGGDRSALCFPRPAQLSPQIRADPRPSWKVLGEVPAWGRRPPPWSRSASGQFKPRNSELQSVLDAQPGSAKAQECPIIQRSET